MKKVMKYMKKAAATLLALNMACTSHPIAFAKECEMYVTNLKVNYVTNPIGTDTENITFSWQSESDFVGKKQTGYEIKVYEDDKVLWQSEEKSSKSVGIAYGGEALDEGKEYFWSVTITDEDGEKYESEKAKFETGVTNLDEWKNAPFVGMETECGMSLVKRDFETDEKIKSARLYAAAIGIYEAEINGEKVYAKSGDEKIYYHMAPGYDNGGDSMTYQTYDIGDMLNEKNTIVFKLSHGWRDENGNGVLGESKGRGGIKALLAISYESGKKEYIATDASSWQGSVVSPVTASGIYYGEDYDARLEEKAEWTNVTKMTYRGKIVPSRNMEGKFVTDFDCAVQSYVIYDGEKKNSSYAGGEINIVKEGKSLSGGVLLKKGEVAVLDMGQNLSAVPKITFSGKEGKTVTLKMAEMLNDGSRVGSGATEASGPKGSIYTKSLRGARSEARYTFKDEKIATYCPSASYFGYRYVSISADCDVVLYDLVSKAISSVSERTGFIETNNADVNRLFLNALYGQFSNFFTIPTDCNQRDERLAWTGDEQAFAKSANYNFDSTAFLMGYQDILSELTRKQGYPGAVTSLSNYFNHWAMGWSDAEVINAVSLYNVTGDENILLKNYDALNKYMDYMRSIERDEYSAPKIQTRAYGDWLAFQGTGYEVIADYYYGYMNLLMAKVAHVVNDGEKEVFYRDYFEKIKEKFLENHVEFDKAVSDEYEKTEIPTIGENVIENKFEKRNARFVRVTVYETANGTKNDNEYRLQIMEAQVLENGVNVALGKSVDTNDDFVYSNMWAKRFMTDGNVNTGYTSSDRKTTNHEKNPIWVCVDLGEEHEVDNLKMVCREFDKPMIEGICVNYPKRYKIETSCDNKTWTDAGKYYAYDSAGERLRIKSSVGSSLFMNKGGVFEDNSQTALLWMLKLGFYDSDDMKNECLRLLCENIENIYPKKGSVRANYAQNTLSVGFLGTNVIAPILSEEGQSRVSYDLLLSCEMPSWLFEVKSGATTIWERWNSFSEGKGFGDAEMNSFNHFAYGSVVEWMYEYMAGIAPSENGGFENFVLQPVIDTGEKYNEEERINHVKGKYVSPYGTIESEWKSEEGHISYYRAVVPTNTSAVLYLPIEGKCVKSFENIPGVTYLGQKMHQNGEKAVFEVLSGEYVFEIGNFVTAKIENRCIGNAESEENGNANIFLNLSEDVITGCKILNGEIEIKYKSDCDLVLVCGKYSGGELKNVTSYTMKANEEKITLPYDKNAVMYVWKKESLCPICGKTE